MPGNPHDPRPQNVIRTSSGTNATEPVNAYVDQSLTKRNIDNGDVEEALPARSGSTTLGEITVYEKEGTNHEPGDQGATPPANAPNYMAPGRDLYANNGAVGQGFVNNPPTDD